MKKFLNAKEASEEFEVSITTIIDWFKKGKFPNAFKIESTIRIPLADIEALKHSAKEAG